MLQEALLPYSIMICLLSLKGICFIKLLKGFSSKQFSFLTSHWKLHVIDGLGEVIFQLPV